MIFVVGELDDQFLTPDGTPLRWSASKNKSTHTFRKLFDLPNIFDKNSAPDGIVGSRETVKRWLVQVDSYNHAKLVFTRDEVMYGTKLTDTEYTYEVHEHDNNDAVFGDSVFVYCTCRYDKKKRCVHYIQ